MQRFSHKASSVLEKKIFERYFYYIWAWRQSWSMDGNHFSNLSFLCPKETPNEIWTTLARRLQRRSLKFLTFFPYKYIGKQTWPRRKKVKCQCTTIILATLIDLSSPIIWAKIQPQCILGFEEDFWRLFHIWAWRPSWSMEGNHFSNLSFPWPREAPNEIWATLAKRL